LRQPWRFRTTWDELALSDTAANKPQRTPWAHCAGAREATGSTCTWRIETPVTDLLPLKAGANPAAVVPHTDQVGVCTAGDHPPIVVDVTVMLPH